MINKNEDPAKLFEERLRNHLNTLYLTVHEYVQHIMDNFKKQSCAPEIEGLSTRDFCVWLAEQETGGEMIIMTHNLVDYIQKNKEGFKGCFYQESENFRFKIFKEEMREKLNTLSLHSAIHKRYLKRRKEVKKLKEKNNE